MKEKARRKPLAAEPSQSKRTNYLSARKKTKKQKSIVQENPIPYETKKQTDTAKPRFIDLFAGIGGIRLGLERAGGKCVFSSEWDADAARTYAAYFGDSPAGDITKIPNSAIPDHDILAGGFPCQAFSIMGGMKGFADTRGTLFFEIERILREKQPKAFLLENVRNLVAHDKGKTFKVILEKLQMLGYHVHWRVLNALDFNLPQKRTRVLIVGFKENHLFEWPQPKPLKNTLADILEPDDTVSKKHIASEKIQISVQARLVGKKLPPTPWICHENKAGNISPLSYSCALRAGASVMTLN